MSIPDHLRASIEDLPLFEAQAFSVLRELEEEGDEELFIGIARQFLADVEDLLARLDPAIRECDRKSIASIAHTLKGSAATFGLIQMQEIALQLELSANAPDAGDSVCWFEWLKRSFLAGRLGLEAELNKV